MPHFSTLDRYLLREFLASTLATIVVLLVIFTGATFAEVVNGVATGRLPGGVMFTVLGLGLVNTLQALLPMAMFLGILLALGRMYRDNEMHVLAASGFGPKGLLRPAALLALGTALVVGMVAVWLGPLASRTSDAAVAQANRSLIAAGLEAGRFTSLAGNGGVLFTNSLSADGSTLGKLFVEREHTDANGRTTLSIITATSGELYHDNQQDQRLVALHDGYRYDLPLGGNDWRIMRFERNDVALTPAAAVTDDTDDVRSTLSLFGDIDPAARAELQWRLAIPFGPLVLAMLALPLARQGPRSSPVGRVLVAVLAYLVIMNLMTVARSLIAAGKLASAWGMWWVLLPVFVGAAWFYTRQYATRKQRATAATAA